jgi:sortase A
MNQISHRRRRLSSTWGQVLRGACYLFLVFGILSLGYVGFVLADSQTYQTLEKKKFREAGRLAEPHTLVEGDVIGEILAPRLGLDAIVVQGESRANLRRAVSHLTKSALPGERGNVTLAAHRDTFFRPLRGVRVGDKIQFKTLEHSFDYIVESVEVVEPTSTQVLEATTGHDLTLITCFPFHYVGPAPKRFIVRAREVNWTLLEQPAVE